MDSCLIEEMAESDRQIERESVYYILREACLSLIGGQDSLTTVRKLKPTDTRLPLPSRAQPSR